MCASRELEEEGLEQPGLVGDSVAAGVGGWGLQRLLHDTGDAATIACGSGVKGQLNPNPL